MDSYPRRSRSPRSRDEYRRRSPNSYDRTSRRRSRSPVSSRPVIDRYEPGREYIPPRSDDFRRSDDTRRRSPPAPNAKNIDRYVPGQNLPPSRDAPLFNRVPNPLNLESQAGFTYFMEWFREEQKIKDEKDRSSGRAPARRVVGEQESKEEREKERERVQEAYDAYKVKYSMQMARAFVHQHKDEEWFKERYDPIVRDPIRSRLNEFRRGNFAQWTQDLDSGVFDAFTLEGIYKNDSNGAGGIVEKEEGEATAATEVLGVSDLVPSKGAELRDEAALQPALLIKTIAPQVSHAKLEALCKEHLGDGDGGFRWLSLSDPNPTKKFHRIGWILLNPTDEAIVNGKHEEVKGEEDGDDAKMAEDVGDDTKSYIERALAEIDGKSIEDEAKGSFQCHVGVHIPQTAPRKKALWDLFSAPDRIEADLTLAERLVSKLEQELGEDINAVSKIEDRVESMRGDGKLQPQQNGAADKLMKSEDEDVEEGEEEEELDDENDDEDLLVKKKKLDLLIEYLRRVFNFCFFCVFEADSVHELARKCPNGHLRRPRASLTSSAKAVAKASANMEEFPFKKQSGPEGKEDEDEKQPRFQRNNRNHQQLQRAFNWVKTYEDKIFQILEPEGVDLAKLGGKSLPEGLEDELKKFVNREDESKYRCKVPECTKLFKGDSFWRKHVDKRHAEWLELLRKELQEVNNYVLDPARIVPSRNDANSTGHFPTNGMASGTPRNFNIGSLGQVSMGGGAQRTGRGRFGGNRAGGPYDRGPQDSRNARWRGGGGSGRSDVGRPRGGPHPDALAVGGGSREATSGRSLKSYEDLDAVGGSGNGALDY